MKAGDTLGSYEIVSLLGEGGMGRVWLARDTRLGRKVALKTLPGEIAASDARRRRFEHEARAVAALNHPNVVTLYSIERERGISFITMEYVAGRRLDDLIPDQGLDAEPFFGLALPLVEAVASAHRQGITHRDLKPANVMVAGDGRVKVLDFGLAVREPPAGAAADAGETRTTEGLVAGTLPYMSPEQLRGEAVGPSSDVFSLGILLHEMLGGRRPFAGTSQLELATAILRDDPPPLDAARLEPIAEVGTLVRRCLEKDPAGRPPTAGALHEELEAARRAWAEGRLGPVAPRPESAAQRRGVAVLDFENLAHDPASDWLSGGIAETLTVDLKKQPALDLAVRGRVVAALAELGAEGAADEVRVGRAVGADLVVAGAFQCAGGAIRVTVRVVDVAAGKTLETVKVDGALESIFDVQDRVVQELAARLVRPCAPRTETFARESAEAIVLERGAQAATGRLAAFECFALARREVHRMEPSGFARASELLARAVEIDPGYAAARAGLGHLYAMKFIGTTDPADLRLAIDHLQAAVRGDPELAEPYPWLAYGLMREGRLAESVAAGRRGVTLDPSGSTAHYMLAAALWVQALREHRRDLWDELLDHFAESGRLEPRYQAAHQLRGAALLFLGRYTEARAALQPALAIESEDRYALARFVGAHAVAARLAFRAGDLDEAERLARRSIELIGSREHVYTAAMVALSHGVRADALMRRGLDADAVSELRAALARVEAQPRSLGLGAVLVRTRLALARCFWRQRMTREAALLFEQATDLLRARKGWDFSWTIEVTEPDLQYELALCHAASRREGDALAALGRAAACGWSDAQILRAEPELESVRARAELAPILEQVEGRDAAGSP